MDFTKPEDNVARLGLQEGNKVAVFGSGAGGHSIAASKAMNHSGQIYAIDVRKDMLDKMLENAKMEGSMIIKGIHANIEEAGKTGIGDHACDAVIIPNTLFSYDDRPGIMQEAKRILKPTGKVLIVDWKDAYGGMGPQAENLVTQEQAEQLAADAGFKVSENFSAGAQHYGLILEKNL